MSRYRDLIVGIVLLTVSVIYYWLSLSIPEAAATQMGPTFVPQVIAGLTFVLSIILVLNSLQTLRTQPADATEAEEPHGEEVRYVPVVLTGILLVIYVVVLERVGFVLATAVYLFLQFNVAAPKTRKALKYQAYYLVGSIAAAFVINYLFRDGFDVMLPQGMLG